MELAPAFCRGRLETKRSAAPSVFDFAWRFFTIFWTIGSSLWQLDADETARSHLFVEHSKVTETVWSQ
jgi:hypothetical protein